MSPEASSGQGASRSAPLASSAAAVARSTATSPHPHPATRPEVAPPRKAPPPGGGRRTCKLHLPRPGRALRCRPTCRTRAGARDLGQGPAPVRSKPS